MRHQDGGLIAREPGSCPPTGESILQKRSCPPRSYRAQPPPVLRSEVAYPRENPCRAHSVVRHAVRPQRYGHATAVRQAGGAAKTNASRCPTSNDTFGSQFSVALRAQIETAAQNYVIVFAELRSDPPDFAWRFRKPWNDALHRDGAGIFGRKIDDGIPLAEVRIGADCRGIVDGSRRYSERFHEVE